MPKRIKKRSKKVGLEPGTLIHIGEKKTEKVRIRIIDYDETHFHEKEAETLEECFPFKDKPTVAWIDIAGIHQTEVIEKIGSHFGLHSLTTEDILNTDQRPKMEDFGSYLYIVLKILFYDEKKGEVASEQISIILGQTFVLSFQEMGTNIFNPLIERIRGSKGHIKKLGADYLAYSLLDSIVDNYFIILEKLGEDIELLEEKLITHPTREMLQTLHNLKREMIFLRKAVWPLREVISGLERGESALVKDTTRIYLRDVYDHTVQVIDSIETSRDMLSGMLDIYLSSISNKLNEVMKVLTVIATIFMPLTFIAGVYGMNFKYIPELEWKWGYFTIWAVMAVIAGTMLIYFRKKKWL
ncbi:MAG: magnesium/cobalt transporter CorA [Candidatus Brocadiales bacterium]